MKKTKGKKLLAIDSLDMFYFQSRKENSSHQAISLALKLAEIKIVPKTDAKQLFKASHVAFRSNALSRKQALPTLTYTYTVSHTNYGLLVQCLALKGQ